MWFFYSLPDAETNKKNNSGSIFHPIQQKYTQIETKHQQKSAVSAAALIPHPLSVEPASLS